MQALPPDVMERVCSCLTSLQLHVGVTDWATWASRFRPFDWDKATHIYRTHVLLTEEALKEWCHRMGFHPHLRMITARSSWTVAQQCHRHDLAVTATLGSIAKAWEKPMLTQAKKTSASTPLMLQSSVAASTRSSIGTSHLGSQGSTWTLGFFSS